MRLTILGWVADRTPGVSVTNASLTSDGMVVRERRTFTFIEVRVVMAIIVLLMNILLPSLSKARAHSKTVVCPANLRHLGQAMADYQSASSLGPGAQNRGLALGCE